MKTINYNQFNESLTVEKLENGLSVYLLPKKGFQKTTAILGVNYGSVDTDFSVDGKKVHQPAGIAHFLEHKMFDKKDYDVFELFNQTGASANAYTSFTKTNYLFSAADNLKQNLNILLDFVQIPYFTTEKIAREKGIIDQEINMYANDPDNRLYFQTIQNLYPNSPLAADVAGTEATVNQITLSDVELAYRTFYRPENMALFVVGHLNPEETLSWIKENQQKKPQYSAEKVTRKLALPAVQSNGQTRTHLMPISRPKVAVGFRGNDVVQTGKAGLTYELALSLAFDLFFSETASSYDQLYQSGVIDDSFSWEFENERGFHFAVLNGDTSNPKAFIDDITAVAMQIPKKLATMAQEFELQKKELFGSYLGMMDSEEAISGQFDAFLGETLTIFDEVDILESLSLSDVIKAAKLFFGGADIQSEIIQPTE